MAVNKEEPCVEAIDPLRVIKERYGDLPSGFGTMYVKIMKDGALSLREKELVAMGIALALRCEPCMKAHAKKALELGISVEELLEVAGVAVVMGGGPAYMYSQKLVEILNELGALK